MFLGGCVDGGLSILGFDDEGVERPVFWVVLFKY